MPIRGWQLRSEIVLVGGRSGNLPAMCQRLTNLQLPEKPSNDDNQPPRATCVRLSLTPALSLKKEDVRNSTQLVGWKIRGMESPAVAPRALHPQ